VGCVGSVVVRGKINIMVARGKDKKNLNKKPIFPDEKEIERITKHFSDPNCKEINEGLMPNANELDKAKYNICQSISRYKRVNKLTPNELAKKIKISKEKTDDILFGRIANFNFEELVSYTEKLKGHLEVKINYEGEKASASI
jgi:predicted XRE-type DNA-binding protein